MTRNRDVDIARRKGRSPEIRDSEDPADASSPTIAGARKIARGTAKPLPPPTMHERTIAGEAARALRNAIADPATMGAPASMQVDHGCPRWGEWWVTWGDLPGFVRVNGRGGHYHHRCLPGRTYARHEIVAEMIPDLEALAERGVHPTEETSAGAA